jgi:hypothetical protein
MQAKLRITTLKSKDKLRYALRIMPGEFYSKSGI